VVTGERRAKPLAGSPESGRDTGMAESLHYYYQLLGLEPGATLDEVNTAYYSLVERFSESPSDEDLEVEQRIRHAYAVLRRSFEGQTSAPEPASRRGRTFAVIALLAAVLVTGFVLANLSRLSLMITHFDYGDVLRWQNKQSPYGVVVGYSDDHRFRTGAPTPAYEIRPVDSDETVWLSKRVVVRAMRKVDAAPAEKAGI
jgi:hypothetical protein